MTFRAVLAVSVGSRFDFQVPIQRLHVVGGCTIILLDFFLNNSHFNKDLLVKLLMPHSKLLDTFIVLCSIPSRIPVLAYCIAQVGNFCCI